MPLKKLPAEHHVMRFVPWGKLRKSDDPEVAIGILGEAFKPRPVDEGKLSTTWLEYFAGDRTAQIESSVKAIRASKLVVKPKSGFAIGKVEAILKTAENKGHQIRVVHDPEDDNKAHVSVTRWPVDDMELFELLAADAWSELVLNKDIVEGEVTAPDTSAWQEE